MGRANQQIELKALNGIYPQGGFLHQDTIIHFIQSEGFRQVRQKYINESLRRFRDDFVEFQRQWHKAKQRKLPKGIQEVTSDWWQRVVSYLGYNNLQVANYLDPHSEAEIRYYKSESQNVKPDVILFFSLFVSPEDRLKYSENAEQSGLITDLKGHFDHRQTPLKLAESVQRYQKSLGHENAILFLPDKAYLFRLDAVTVDQYLEIRWDEVLSPHQDDAAALATFLLHADSFIYRTQHGNNEDSVTNQSCPLDNIFAEDLEQRRKLTTELYKQVQVALEILIEERLNREPKLRKQIIQNPCENILSEIFRQGLFVLYRILFILYAEAKGTLPVKDSRYRDFYSFEHLKDVSLQMLMRQPSQQVKETFYLWKAIKSLFVILQKGAQWPQGGLELNVFNGELFSPKYCPYFDRGPDLPDHAIAQVIVTLTSLPAGQYYQERRFLNFGSLGIEQLGAIYEMILNLQPKLISEDSAWCWVGRDQVELVPKELAQSRELKVVNPEALYKYVHPWRPSFLPKLERFFLAVTGDEKKETASYYTHPKLTEFIVQRTLKPLVEGKSSQEILSLKILEPAVGSGGFLIAAIRYMAHHLVLARQKESSIDSRQLSPEQLYQRAKGDILTHCLFAVDVNPLSLELCRTSLYLETMGKDRPLPHLAHHLLCGNSLVGADLLGRRLSPRLEEVPWIFDIPLEPIFEQNPFKLNFEWISSEARNPWEEAWQAKGSKLRQEWNQIHQADWQDWAKQKQESLHAALENLGQQWQDLDQKSQNKVKDVEEFEQAWIQLKGPEGLYQRLKLVGDFWTSLWFWPHDQWESFPSFDQFRKIMDHLLPDNKETNPIWPKGEKKILEIVTSLAKKHQFFHWALAFPHVFISNKKGFDVVLTNPPWQVHRFDSDDIFNLWDPSFSSLTGDEKRGRRQELIRTHQYTEKGQEAFLKHYHHEQEGLFLSYQGQCQELSGRKDLVQIFCVQAFEEWTGPKSRLGLLTSFQPLFGANTFSSLRKEFLKKHHIEELVVFKNRQKIFPIHSRFSFSASIITKNKRKSSDFPIHYPITRLSELDTLGEQTHVTQSPQMKTQFYSLELQRLLSPEHWVVALFPHPEIAELTKQLIGVGSKRAHIAIGDIEEFSQVRSGINQTQGIRRGIARFGRDLDTKQKDRWIPLYRGQDYYRWELRTPKEFERYLDPDYKVEAQIPDGPFIVWRVISATDNQHALVASLIPQRTYFDNNCYGFFCANEQVRLVALALMGSTTMDLVVKNLPGNNRAWAQISPIPIPNDQSSYLTKAVNILKETIARGKNPTEEQKALIDALVWCHWTLDKPYWDKKLRFIMDVHCATLVRNNREYVERFLGAVEKERQKDAQWQPTPIFTSKSKNNKERKAS